MEPTDQTPAVGQAPATDLEQLRKELADARADVVRMAQTKVGEKCDHHRQPLAVLEAQALRECPICWKACAENLEAQLRALAAPSVEPDPALLEVVKAAVMAPLTPANDREHFADMAVLLWPMLQTRMPDLMHCFGTGRDVKAIELLRVVLQQALARPVCPTCGVPCVYRNE